MNALNLELLEALRPLGLSTQQFRVMQVIFAHSGVSITAISRDAIIEQSVVSRIVDQLERREFVKRRKASGNARVVEVTLTPVGVAVLESIFPHAYSIVERATSILSRDDHSTLLKLLARVLQHIRPAESQLPPSVTAGATAAGPGESRVEHAATRASASRRTGKKQG